MNTPPRSTEPAIIQHTQTLAEAREAIARIAAQRDELEHQLRLLKERSLDLEYDKIVAQHQCQEANRSRRLAEEASQVLVEDLKMLREEHNTLAQLLTMIMTVD
ncbi:hypothetical protein BU17DRAFT_66311 [Hysterangium stoloniferum]|nr:hypothetical protein BU17DRAFT_66311 [Hysterangium stoloniferum]